MSERRHSSGDESGDAVFRGAALAPSVAVGRFFTAVVLFAVFAAAPAGPLPRFLVTPKLWIVAFIIIAGGVALWQRFENRVRRATRYRIGPESLLISGPRGDATLPFDQVTRLAAVVSPVGLAGTVVLTAGRLSFLLHGENHTRMVAALEAATGIEAAEPPWLLWKARRSAAPVLLVALVLSLIALSSRPSPVTAALVGLTGMALALLKARGRFEAAPSPAPANVRWATAAAVAIVALMCGGHGVYRWRHSFFAALDLARWRAAPTQSRIVGDIPGVTFTVPAGWRVGRALENGRHWLVFISGDESLIVFQAAQIPEGMTTDFYLYENAVHDRLRALARRRRGGPANAVDAEGMQIGNAAWYAFREGSLLGGDSKPLTLWQGSGRTAYSLTFERGGPDDAAVRELLSRFHIEQPLAPPPPPDRPLDQ